MLSGKNLQKDVLWHEIQAILLYFVFTTFIMAGELSCLTKKLSYISQISHGLSVVKYITIIV